MNAIQKTALGLVIIGALNWGLVGLFRFNLVAAIFGDGALSRIVYTLVGLSGLYCLSLFANARSTSAVDDARHEIRRVA